MDPRSKTIDAVVLIPEVDKDVRIGSVFNAIFSIIYQTENTQLSSGRDIVVEGLKGEFFILSGSAFARHDKTGETVTDLPGDLRWNGTAILIKIPAETPADFNIYNYIS